LVLSAGVPWFVVMPRRAELCHQCNNLREPASDKNPCNSVKDLAAHLPSVVFRCIKSTKEGLAGVLHQLEHRLPTDALPLGDSIDVRFLDSW